MTTTAPLAVVDERGPTMQLRITSGDGPITRTVLRTPPRDAGPLELPVIDISGAYSPSLETRRQVARQLRDACTNTGFFYIANHGVPADVLGAAHAASLEFFRQPRAVKEHAGAGRSRVHNGYKPPRSQRINPFESIDARESFSWKYDPRYDETVADLAAIPSEIARCLVSEEFLWDATSNLPRFKEAILEYWRSCLRLARALLRSFSLSLDLPEDYFDEKFTHPDATFRYVSVQRPCLNLAQVPCQV
jgi:isopenicillin N synthase-like dioxygenase